jgi:hypothetical protein
LANLIFQLFKLSDIRIGSKPFHHLPLLIKNGKGSPYMPAIGMVGTTPQSKFDLIWLLGVAGLGPTFQTSRQIIRMKKLLPSLTNDLIEETAKILDDPLIDMNKRTIR